MPLQAHRWSCTQQAIALRQTAYHRGTSLSTSANVTCYLQVQCHMLLTSPMSHATYKSNVTCYLHTSITSLLSAQEFPTANFDELCTRMHFCNYSSYIRPHQTHICVRLTLSFWVVLPLTSCMWWWSVCACLWLVFTQAENNLWICEFFSSCLIDFSWQLQVFLHQLHWFAQWLSQLKALNALYIYHHTAWRCMSIHLLPLSVHIN